MAVFKMDRAKHIFTYAESLEGGGVERAQLRLARGWIEAGRRVTLAIGCPEGPLAAEIPPGLEVIRLGGPTYRSLFAVPGIVRKTKPDIIFCPGSYYTSIALWTRLRLAGSCPPIVSKVSNAMRRDDHPPLIAAGHSVWLRTHPWFLDRIVAMTDASVGEVLKTTRIDASRVAIIANPPALPLPGSTIAGLPPRYILGVGRLVRQKRWDRLLDAMPRLAEKLPLVILGEGEERAAIEARARALGVDLRLLGHAPDPLLAMRSAKVLALTSDYEGVPGVLREALSVGTPVVTTDSSPAVAEIVTSPELGTIVSTQDTDGLVRALDQWVMASAQRPAPVAPPGADSALRYLELFDALMSGAPVPASLPGMLGAPGKPLPQPEAAATGPAAP
ncbi:MAG: glycosyltransferase [Candidatus Sphingomonas colombiensis]|nr:glycosyltransferase [Sphingomonas sp.]WEK44230.1 MAG: glycosyltransferase [Sphingomonas sp.]